MAQQIDLRDRTTQARLKKEVIVEWLNNRKIKFEHHMIKTELTELAIIHLPPKRYIVNRVAS